MGDISAAERYFDLGATDQKFVEEAQIKHIVRAANNTSMQAVAKCSVVLDSTDGRIDASGVLKIPDLATTMLSVSVICKKGKTVIFTMDKCEVLDESGDLVVSGVEEGGLYRINPSEQSILAGGIDI